MTRKLLTLVAAVALSGCAVAGANVIVHEGGKGEAQRLRKAFKVKIWADAAGINLGDPAAPDGAQGLLSMYQFAAGVVDLGDDPVIDPNAPPTPPVRWRRTAATSCDLTAARAMSDVVCPLLGRVPRGERVGENRVTLYCSGNVSVEVVCD